MPWRQSEIWVYAHPVLTQALSAGTRVWAASRLAQPQGARNKAQRVGAQKVTPGRGQGCEGQATPSWQEVSALCSLPDRPPTPSPQDRQLEGGGGIILGALDLPPRTGA